MPMSRKTLGATYRVTGNSSPTHHFELGALITLTRDDGSDAPDFEGPDGKGGRLSQYVSLRDVRRARRASRA